ncbi:MAG: LPS export ABC transporter ATP-binding protein [Proteobacteria bacterium]|nr:LPS export ABC transporter ATP-binding protein [Pseudomonadota bacterium]NOG60737.1 LPS export ABC transporter ATP-binding protein [Pseudomonadota bacterium]
MSILSIRHLSKSYRSRKVVSDVSLSVQSGETIGLLGANGAGKTTSFYMIVGLVPSDNGTIHLDNREISRLTMDERSHLGLGYLPQEASVFRKLTVEENIMAILETRLPDNPDKAKQRLELLLQEFHIAHLRENLGMSLSGGERRRLEIARALASEPRFLLLDEPFAGIDPISINDIQRLIHRLCDHGIGVLITDHNVRETLGICDRAYVVHDGKILAEGTTEQILNNEQVRDVYLGDEFTL